MGDRGAQAPLQPVLGSHPKNRWTTPPPSLVSPVTRRAELSGAKLEPVETSTQSSLLGRGAGEGETEANHARFSAGAALTPGITLRARQWPSWTQLSSPACPWTREVADP